MVRLVSLFLPCYGSSMVTLVLACLDHNVSYIELFLRCLANKLPVEVYRQLTVPPFVEHWWLLLIFKIYALFIKVETSCLYTFPHSLPAESAINPYYCWFAGDGRVSYTYRNRNVIVMVLLQYTVAPKMKRCVVEVPIVFRFPACCVLQPFIYAFFNLSFTSPCTMFILPHLHIPFPAFWRVAKYVS